MFNSTTIFIQNSLIAYLSTESLLGLGFLGVQEILFTSQVDILGCGDRALEGVTKAAIVLGQARSGDGLGNRAG